MLVSDEAIVKDSEEPDKKDKKDDKFIYEDQSISLLGIEKKDLNK